MSLGVLYNNCVLRQNNIQIDFTINITLKSPSTSTNF